MEKLMRKYAQVLLNTCLKIEKNQALFINYNIERYDFVRIVSEEAMKLGVRDIYYNAQDPYIKHGALKTMNIKELKESGLWDRSIWNEYAKKHAAFLMLASENPGLMDDVDPKKLSEITKYSYETMTEFDNLRDKSEIAWCIAAVPTLSWAQKLFPKDKEPLNSLWNKIFEVCYINKNNPEELVSKQIEKQEKIAKKLNKLNLKTLIYKNSLGTNLKIDLHKEAIWLTGMEKLYNGKEILCNYPSLEIFTSPDCKSAEGTVYSSKPLLYQDNLINDFNITFKKGKVISFKADVGNKNLKEMIGICKNSDLLGEVALVPYDSMINNTNMIFYETLYDENASCHLALGAGFPNCINGGEKKNKKELFDKYHLNDSKSHIDFMIGTKDLNIIGITYKGEEIKIFENGNFSENI